MQCSRNRQDRVQLHGLCMRDEKCRSGNTKQERLLLYKLSVAALENDPVSGDHQGASRNRLLFAILPGRPPCRMIALLVKPSSVWHISASATEHDEGSVERSLETTACLTMYQNLCTWNISTMTR